MQIYETQRSLIRSYFPHTAIPFALVATPNQHLRIQIVNIAANFFESLFLRAYTVRERVTAK